MPNFVIMRVSDIPAVGQTITGQIRVESAVDADTAIQQALQSLGDVRPGVVGITLASNITRRTFAPPSGQYTVT